MRKLTRIAFAALTLAPALVPQAHAGSVTSTPVVKVAPSGGLIKPIGPVDGRKPAGLGRLGLRANGVEILQFVK